MEGYVLVKLPELKKSAELISLAKIETVKYIVAQDRSGIWQEQGDILRTYSDEDVADAWENFYRKGLISRECTTQIGTCCFRHDSNGDGETDEIFWSVVVDRIE